MTASTERPVRFAAIGLDHAHIFGLITGLLASGCELVGISSDDPDASVAKEVRQRWPEARWVPDRGELLKNGTIDLVVTAAVPALSGRPRHRSDAATERTSYSINRAVRPSDELPELRGNVADTGRIWSV